MSDQKSYSSPISRIKIFEWKEDKSAILLPGQQDHLKIFTDPAYHEKISNLAPFQLSLLFSYDKHNQSWTEKFGKEISETHIKNLTNHQVGCLEEEVFWKAFAPEKNKIFLLQTN